MLLATVHAKKVEGVRARCGVANAEAQSLVCALSAILAGAEKLPRAAWDVSRGTQAPEFLTRKRHGGDDCVPRGLLRQLWPLPPRWPHGC